MLKNIPALENGEYLLKNVQYAIKLDIKSAISVQKCYRYYSVLYENANNAVA